MEHVYECKPDGKKLRTGRDAVDVMSAAGQDAAWILIPVECLDEDLFRLKTGVAGEFLQKFLTYGLRVAITGDIARFIEASSALRDFVYESNRGGHIWFVANNEEFAARLQQRAAGA